jgi:ketosteroid isomerase-like protein
VISLFAAVVITIAMQTSAAVAQQIQWEKPPRTAAERAVARVDSLRLAALLRGDTAVVNRVYADNFRSVLPTGAVRTKSEFMRGLSTGQQRYDVVRHTEQRIQVFGEVAIITGRSTQQGRESTTDSSLVAQTRYTRIYVRRQKRWQLILTQLTAVSASPRGAANER